MGEVKRYIALPLLRVAHPRVARTFVTNPARSEIWRDKFAKIAFWRETVFRFTPNFRCSGVVKTGLRREEITEGHTSERNASGCAFGAPGVTFVALPGALLAHPGLK